MGTDRIANVFSGIALLVSILALILTGLQWWKAHSQLLLSMKPTVDFTMSTDEDDPPVGMSIENAGPGPARIKSITYFVDRKEVGDVGKALEFGNLPDVEDIHTLDFDDGDTLAVGGTVWLVKYMKMAHRRKDAREPDALATFIEQHLAVEVEFCPVLSDNCYKRCSTKGWCR
jgi:hypothetical protein